MSKSQTMLNNANDDAAGININKDIETNRTHYNYSPDGTFEINQGEEELDTAGYISETDRIQEFLNSGMKLSNFREGYYDSDTDPSDDELLSSIIGRDYHTDLTDIDLRQQQIEARIKSQELVARTRAKEIQEEKNAKEEVQQVSEKDGKDK